MFSSSFKLYTTQLTKFQLLSHLSASLTLLVSCFVLMSSDVLAQGSGTSAVRVVTVEKSEFNDPVESLGTLRANEFVTVSVNVTETITAIHFDDGEAVSKGQVLVEMTSEEEHALLNEAQTNAAEAKRQLKRIRELVKTNTASESTLDARQRDYDAAKARLVATQSRLRDRVIVAPFDGVVGLRNVSVGALVRPGDVITTLTDSSVMKLDFTIPSRYLTAIKVGSPIKAVTSAFSNAAFSGTVSSIDNVIDPITRSIKVRAIIPNPEGILKPGLLMQVEILANQRESLVIPEEAIIPSGQENYVFVLLPKGADDFQTVEKRIITTASRRYGEVEVTSGLAAGEQVVTHGADKLSPGARIEIKNTFQAADTLKRDQEKSNQVNGQASVN